MDIRIKLDYLVPDRDRHGNIRYYVRYRDKPKVRIRETPGTPAFLDAYNKALTKLKSGECGEGGGKPEAVTQGSLRWLVEQYYKSAEFKGLSASTRKARKRILDRLCQTNGRGEKPIARLESLFIQRWRDELFETPEAANTLIKTVRTLFGFAVKNEILDTNPAVGVEKIKTASTGHHTWTPEEVKQFEARHPVGSKARLAMALMLYTGVRRSDAVRLGPQMERGGRVCFTEYKGRERKPKQRDLPILPELREIIDASPSGHLAYLVTSFGKPFTANGFGNWFKKRCKEAGLPHCSAHGLRKAAATIAAERGATDRQMMAIFGWETAQQVKTYTQAAERKRLVDASMHLLGREQESNKTVPLSGPGVSHRQEAAEKQGKK